MRSIIGGWSPVFDGHPFHIHINPFLVCALPPAGAKEPNTKGRIFEPPFAHWHDTYLVNLDRTVDFPTEYRAFTGTYVYHCHKLTHEDHGMMERIKVCDPRIESCDTLCSDGQVRLECLHRRRQRLPAPAGRRNVHGRPEVVR